MKKPNITKGKWVLGDENNSSCEVALPNDSTIRLDKYSRSGRYSRYSHEFIMSSDEMLSNAHLIIEAGNLTNGGFNISALPDLVEALERMEFLTRHWEKDEGKTVNKGVRKKLKEALNKAKFES